MAAIKDVGGRTAYDWEMRNGRYGPGTEPPRASVTSRAVIGIDYFGHVTDVWLYTNSNPNAAMEHVGNLFQLQRLTVSGRSLSDAGMASLGSLTRLSKLDISNTQITDDGVTYLNGLTELSTLDLSGTRISDAGLAHLRGLIKLSVLDLRNTKISDHGLAQLMVLVTSRSCTWPRLGSPPMG